jgi:hypothetical protein
MIAPRQQGTYQSNWKMQNASGVLFGIGPGGDSPFWVRIEVVAPPTDTPAPSLDASPTPTASTMPEIHVTGELSLAPNDRVDLDTLRISTEMQGDLLFQVNETEIILLTPQEGAQLGVHGSTSPTLLACQSTSLSGASLPVESLSTGTYLCHRSDQGRYGWIYLADFDPQDISLEIGVTTWAALEP